MLTPERVASPAFGLLCKSALGLFNGTPPRLFAVPLYVNKLELTLGPHASRTVSLLYAVTTTGFATVNLNS